MKQLTTEVVIIMMLNEAVARYIEVRGRHQWVIGVDAEPCGAAIRALAGKAWLWMNAAATDNETVHAGLNRDGRRRAQLGY